MKQVCLLCERTSPDTNLFCQELYCPAETSPTILGYGEWLGDIEIIRPVVVLRSAVVYEAMHQDEKVLLKVAHPGRAHKEKLRREAKFLQQIRLARRQDSRLPVLLPPYVGTSIQQDAYGIVTLRGHLLYFYLMEFVEAEPLRDILTKNPQLWLNHTGWLVISLAYAVAFMHNHGILHYGLTPETVLVHFDKNQPKAPRILLVDLGVATDGQHLNTDWYDGFIPPAYTAPELVHNPNIQPNCQTDVYGLGLILFEMLVGEPAYTFRLRSDDDVRQAVLEGQRVKLNRIDLHQSVAKIALACVSKNPQQRPQNAAVLAATLMDKQLFGDVPKPKKSRWPSLNTIFVIVSALLAAAIVIALAIQPALMVIVVAVVMIVGLVVYWRAC